MPVYFLIYIDYNEPFLILITGGLEIFLEKKSLNISVKCDTKLTTEHQSRLNDSSLLAWLLFIL